MGPVVKQIMDHPRCAQLREGDIILEVHVIYNYITETLPHIMSRSTITSLCVLCTGEWGAGADVHAQ